MASSRSVELKLEAFSGCFATGRAASCTEIMDPPNIHLNRKLVYAKTRKDTRYLVFWHHLPKAPCALRQSALVSLVASFARLG